MEWKDSVDSWISKSVNNPSNVFGGRSQRVGDIDNNVSSGSDASQGFSLVVEFTPVVRVEIESQEICEQVGSANNWSVFKVVV